MPWGHQNNPFPSHNSLWAPACLISFCQSPNTHHGSPVLSEPHSRPERPSSVARGLPHPPPPSATTRTCAASFENSLLAHTPFDLLTLANSYSSFKVQPHPLLWGASFLLPSLEDFSPLGSSAHLCITDLITLGGNNLVSCPMPYSPCPPHPMHPEHPAVMAKHPRVPHFGLRAIKFHPPQALCLEKVDREQIKFDPQGGCHIALGAGSVSQCISSGDLAFLSVKWDSSFCSVPWPEDEK